MPKLERDPPRKTSLYIPEGLRHRVNLACWVHESMHGEVVSFSDAVRRSLPRWIASVSATLNQRGKQGDPTARRILEQLEDAGESLR